MPVIKIWCLPKCSERKLNRVFDRIVAAAVSVRELGLKDKHSMTVLFPTDMMKFGLGTEIIIEVTGLFIKPERTEEVRNRLAEQLGKTIKELFPKAMVECFVSPFDPTQGFWTNSRMGRRHRPTAAELREKLSTLPVRRGDPHHDRNVLEQAFTLRPRRSDRDDLPSLHGRRDGRGSHPLSGGVE